MATLPEQFGRYRILKKLGHGGMGSVYLAQDTQLERPVALKVPHIEADDEPSVLQRFYREARAAAALNHPNLCQVHDVGSQGDIPYLTMAYVEGQTLAERIKAGAPIPQPEAADIVRKIALALQEAHARGIVHRDLKPANIMINQRGEPVVMDFGLAREAKRYKTRLTRLGSSLGTPSYMSPEQVKGDVDAMGPGCDIYSLGVILYQMLTGHLPFEGPLEAVFGQILTQPPRPPSVHRRDADPRLAAVCLRAMQKEIGKRYADMRAMAAALTEYLQPAAPPIATAVRATMQRTEPVVTQKVLAPVTADRGLAAKKLAGMMLAGAAIMGLVAVVTVGAIITVAVVYWRGGDPTLTSDKKSGTGKTTELAKSAELDLGSGAKLRLARIDPGWFVMGSPADEVGREPLFEGSELQHKVEITRPYYMAVTTVTQAQYRQVMGYNPSWFSAKGKGSAAVAGSKTDDFPVESVSWDDAVKFCKKATALPAATKRGWAVDLPTEAQWEYACRAGTQTPFHFGNSLRAGLANFDGRFPYGGAAPGQCLGQPFPVGGYEANAWGLYDMHGNVWQWCKDWFNSKYYLDSPPRDPPGPASGNSRVLRGGSWGDVGNRCRSACRDILAPASSADNTGFRVIVRPAAGG